LAQLAEKGIAFGRRKKGEKELKEAEMERGEGSGLLFQGERIQAKPK